MASGTATTPSGTFTRNTARQPQASISAPPSDGPTPEATAAVAVQIATAVARRAGGNSGSSSASDAGTTPAAPTACSTRAATSSSGEPATAHQADATVNSASAPAYMRRRPTRSAMRPATTSSAAKTTLYAFRIQDRSAMSVPGNERAMSGNAMLTIVTSRNATNAPTDVSAIAAGRAAREVDFGIRGAVSPSPRGAPIRPATARRYRWRDPYYRWREYGPAGSGTQTVPSAA